MSMEVNSYYSSYSVSYTAKSEELAGFDPNKRYASMADFTNDLFALQRKLKVQYSNLTADSGVRNVEELKEEISQLFPEFTFVSSRPGDVTQGKNLLYIDDRNLQKMVDDPSYKADVYALMGRELAGTQGYHIGGSAWKLTGTVFTLSEDNSHEGGIPYAGMCTGMRLSDSHTFTSRRSRLTVFSSQEEYREKRIREKKAQEEENTVPDSGSEEERLKETWEKEKTRRRDLQEQIQQEAVEKTAERKQLNRDQAVKRYEEQLYR